MIVPGWKVRGRRLKNRRMTFGYKLMLSYCVFILIPVLLVGNIANQIHLQSIREQTHSIIQGTLHQIKNNIMFKLEDMKRISDMLYFDDSLARVLRQYEEGWTSYEVTKDVLLPKFQTAVETANRRIWLSVYLKNDTFREIYNVYDQVDPLESKSRLFDIYHYHRLMDKSWYKHFPSEEVYGTTMQWLQIEDDAEYGRISLLRRLIDISSNRYPYEETGFMRISVSLADLFDSVDFQKIGEGTNLYIEDTRSNVIISSGSNQTVGSDDGPDKKLQGKDLIIRDELPGLNMELVAVVPASIVEKDSVKVRNLTLLICLGCIILFFIVSAIVSRYFGRRVSKIVKVVDSFQEGEFSRRIHFPGNDEFTKIASALNEMGDNIGRLIQEVYVADLEKKQAELESLHAQINPHFLYNTLSSISRLARFGELDKLQRMVLDLAKFYRLSLNDGRNIIPVQNEIEQAQAYVDIQKIKYGSLMQVDYDIEPEVVRYETVKLILQPFIENVLEHAWMGDSIHIKIYAGVSGSSLMFRVLDDGVGFPPGTVQGVTDVQYIKNAGYGIRNVDQRIKLQYGPEYGVTLFSRPGAGTAVQIRLPLVKKSAGGRRGK